MEQPAGNILQFFHHDSWAFTDDLIHTYGPGAKLHGILGVCWSTLDVSAHLGCCDSPDTVVQEKWLHIYDVKALHAIFVKDQDKEIFTKDKVAQT